YLRRHDRLVALCERAAPASAAGAERAAWWLRAGDARRDSRDEAGAAEAYARALAEDPGAEAPRTALRDLLRRRGDAAGLAALLEEDLERPGADERARRAELAELDDGALAEPASALEQLARLAELAPRDAALRERAVTRALAQARPELACELLRRAACDPLCGVERAPLWIRCAALLASAVDQPAEAVSAYRESLRLDPEQPTVWHALRVLLESLGRSEEALAALRGEWRGAGPEAGAELAAHAADLSLRLGDSDALGAWLARLVAQVPDDAALWLRIAEIHAQGERNALREQALARAAQHLEGDRPRLRDVHRERALLLERELGAPRRAIRALEEAHRLDPRHPDVLAQLERL